MALHIIDMSTGNVNRSEFMQYMERVGLRRLQNALEKSVQPAFYGILEKSLPGQSVSILSSHMFHLVSRVVDEDHLAAHVEDCPGVLCGVLEHCNLSRISRCPTISLAALNCLHKLLKCASLRISMVKAGCLVILLESCALPRKSNTSTSQQSSAMLQQITQCIEVSANILQSFLQLENSEVTATLIQFLTPNLVKVGASVTPIYAL